MSGEVNKHKLQIQRTENPHETCGMFRNSKEVTFLCAFSVNAFIEAHKTDNPTVIGESYLRFLPQFFHPDLPAFPQKTSFQHDIVPAHHCSQVRGLFDNSLRGASWTVEV